MKRLRALVIGGLAASGCLLPSADKVDSFGFAGAGGTVAGVGGAAGASGSGVGGAAVTSGGSGGSLAGGSSSGGSGTGGDSGATQSGGSSSAGDGGTAGIANGGDGGNPFGGSAGNSGSAGNGGSAGTGGAGGLGGSGGKGGASGSGGNSGSAGTSGTGGTGGGTTYPLDCGPIGVALESHGPPSNRVNYVILGDGYTAGQLDTTYLAHVNTMLAARFTTELEPYLRYRKFVNICALQVPSNTSGIGEVAGNTAFEGYGNDSSRLGYVNSTLVNAAISSNLPASFEVDWKAVVFNASSWWNTGGAIMIWAGGHADAALAAQHEGGHSFFQLADEYGGSGCPGPVEGTLRINVTRDSVTTANKWPHFLGFNQAGKTGVQGAFEGGHYCDTGIYRPSDESVMNSLFDSPYFNSISIERVIHVIYDKVQPIDASTPTSVTTPQTLMVDVIDPAVIKVQWSIDNVIVPAATGETFNVAVQGLGSGMHTVTARAYDDTPWVPVGTPHGRADLEQTVQWQITVP